VFPRINNAIAATLVYYNIKHISGAVGVLSGKVTPMKMIDENGKELPPFNEIVFLLHAQLEDEIQQIINLNYPHVRDMVLENLRDYIETPLIKSVQKDHITKLLLDFNAAEEERLLTKHPGGFSRGADPAFLPQYFVIVENALNNLKRIINKYLKMLDNGSFPTYHTPNYLPPNTQPVITDKQIPKKMGLKMTPDQLGIFFRLLLEEGLLVTSNKSEIFRFVSANFELENGEEILFTSFSNNFYKADETAKGWWSLRFRKWVDSVKKITSKNQS
jgi:hypothetical protein